MKTTVTYLPAPMMTEYMMFSDAEKFLQAVKDTGYLIVDVRNNTKTTLNISIQNGSMRYAINNNLVPSLKYHEANGYSISSSQSTVKFHLKTSCGITGLIKHLEAAVIKHIPGMEAIELRIWKTAPVIDMLGRYEMKEEPKYETVHLNQLPSDFQPQLF